MVTLAPPSRTASLEHLLVEGRRRARASGHPIAVSAIERAPDLDPLRLFAASSGRVRAYWEHRAPDRPAHLALVGVDAAFRLATHGPDRFAEADAAWRRALDGALIDDPERLERWGVGPIAMGGARFDPLRARSQPWLRLPDTLLFLPRLALATTGAGAALTITAMVDWESDPGSDARALLALREQLFDAARATSPRHADPHAGTRGVEEAAPEASPLREALAAVDWRSNVAETAREIRERRIDKVVLARRVTALLPAPPDGHLQSASDRALSALTRLRRDFPHAFLYALALPDAGGERIFLGASPERLIRMERAAIETTVLAGSAPRGKDVEADRALGEALLASEKDRHEHRVVADMLREALTPLCRSFDAPERPTLLRLRNVQHLYTPLRGTLDADRSILELVGRLHPTPAVGGFPREAALRAIRERESFDRGLYAAPIGWLDRRGQGEFAVAIRSALLGDREDGAVEAALFAGCGIMGDSDPDREYAESQVKMRAMRAALAE